MTRYEYAMQSESSSHLILHSTMPSFLFEHLQCSCLLPVLSMLQYPGLDGCLYFIFDNFSGFKKYLFKMFSSLQSLDTSYDLKINITVGIIPFFSSLLHIPIFPFPASSLSFDQDSSKHAWG